MPNLSGVLETALYVDDLARSIQFYQDVFHFEKLEGDERLCAMGVAGRQVLLLFKKGASLDHKPPTDGSGNLHLAFSIPASELADWEKSLEENGIAIEKKVTWERGGQSLYFRDPDQHVLELVTPGCWAIY